MAIRFQPEHDITASAGAPTVAFDLDGVLALHGPREKESGEIGKPISSMIKKLKEFLAAGYNVVVFSARLGQGDRREITREIGNWTMKHIGVRLPVTDVKSADWECFFDDKAVQVIRNSGMTVTEALTKR